jgi:hypoxanthine phosphoribosyltransferase
MKKSLKQKDSEYKNIKISDINEIVNILDVNLEEKYVYNQKTNIVVIDNINQSRESFSLDKKMIEKLNKQNSNYKKAIFLYESFVPEETVSEISRSHSHSRSRSRSETSRSRSKREKRSRSETSEDNENELSDEDILAYLN